MTIELKSPAPLYTIAGIGPYAVPHAWRSSADLLVSVHNGTAVIPLRIGEDYTVPASAGDAGGDVILMPGAAAAHAGRVLSIGRLTLVEQGWAGREAREKGLERQLDQLAMALQDRDGFVSVSVALGAADFPTYAAVQLATIPSQQQHLMVRGKGAIGDGRGGLMVRVSIAPEHDGGVQSADGQWWEPRAEHSNRSIKLSYYLRLWNDHRVALIEAVKALYSSADFLTLDGEGIELDVTEKVVLDHSAVGFGGGPSKMDKVICNLSVSAIAGTWAAGDPVVYISGATDGTKVRGLVVANCRFDGGNLADFGLMVSEYYHLSLTCPVVRRMVKKGIVAKKITDDGGHGLIISNPDVRGTFAGPGGWNAQPEWAIDLEDGDAVIEGGYASWTKGGVISRRGGLHVEGLHCSLSDDSLNPKIGIQVNAPRSVFIRGCDMDGCSILVTNSTDNTFSPGVSLDGYRRIQIDANEFLPHPAHDTLNGFIIIRTRTANQSIKGFSCQGNIVLSGDVRILNFGTTDVGSWRTDWEGIVNNAGIANADASNFPGINVLGQTTAAGIFQRGPDTIVRSANGGIPGTKVILQDEGNKTGLQPYYRSAGQAAYWGVVSADGTGVTDLLQLASDGLLAPRTAAQDLGSVATPWRELRAGGARLSDLKVAANDAAAATAGVPVNGIYRESGGLLRMRVS